MSAGPICLADIDPNSSPAESVASWAGSIPLETNSPNHTISVSYYYFETESSILLGQENEILSGQGAGAIQQIKFSDYEEVDGLYFPFTMSMGVKDGQSVPINIESIELNPTVDKSVLTFPEEKN